MKNEFINADSMNYINSLPRPYMYNEFIKWLSLKYIAIKPAGNSYPALDYISKRNQHVIGFVIINDINLLTHQIFKEYQAFKNQYHLNELILVSNKELGAKEKLNAAKHHVKLIDCKELALYYENYNKYLVNLMLGRQ